MRNVLPFRQYLIVNNDEGITVSLRRSEGKALFARAVDILRGLGVAADPLACRVYGPSTGAKGVDASFPFVLSYLFGDLKALADARERIGAYLAGLGGDLPAASARLVLNAGADPVAAVACGVVSPGLAFGTRSTARRLIGARALAPGVFNGKGVNVVIVDRGLNREAIIARHPNSWGGSFDLGEALSVNAGGEAQPLPHSAPGTAALRSHGMMVARNVLDLAPDAKVWDVPIIPEQITDPALFASRANAVYLRILEQIRAQQATSGARWIIMNAWAVYDRTKEWPPGDYTQNRHLQVSLDFTEAMRKQFAIRMEHPLIATVGAMVDADIDVVFSAGNCGVVRPSARCGALDRGRGRSIWGANAHPHVVTVGAVSASANWMGYSSEGPAVWMRSNQEVRMEKPDIAAPSEFFEDDDAALLSSGTSAAAAIVAGAMAALRSEASPWRSLLPAALKRKLIETARPAGEGWNGRTGHGVLDMRSFATTA